MRIVFLLMPLLTSKPIRFRGYRRYPILRVCFPVFTDRASKLSKVSWGIIGIHPPVSTGSSGGIKRSLCFVCIIDHKQHMGDQKKKKAQLNIHNRIPQAAPHSPSPNIRPFRQTEQTAMAKNKKKRAKSFSRFFGVNSGYIIRSGV